GWTSSPGPSRSVRTWAPRRSPAGRAYRRRGWTAGWPGSGWSPAARWWWRRPDAAGARPGLRRGPGCWWGATPAGPGSVPRCARPGWGLPRDRGPCGGAERVRVPECLAMGAPPLVNVQIDDRRGGVHEPLEFGDGEVDFPPVLRALADAGYRGLVAVELPRH